MRWLAIALSLVPAAAAAAPQPRPLALASTDVDGDGHLDQVYVSRDGQVTVLGERVGGSFVLAQPPRAAQLTVFGRKIAVMIENGDGTREGIALELRGHALEVVWRGPVGPVGRDADYDVRIEATAAGFVRYQHRAGIERCDGEPAHLFAELWDGRAFAPARPDVAMPDAAPSIAASAAAPAAIDHPLVYRATAASTQAGAADAGELATPRAIDDGDPATAWRGPADSRGEFFTYRARLSGARAAAIRIVGAGRGHARPARLAVIGGGKAFWIDVPDLDGATWAVLPEPIASPCVSIVIAKVDRGGAADSAIAELAVVSEAELAPGGVERALAGEVAAGGTDGVAAARVVAGRGAAGARALVAEIAAQGGDAAARRRLVAALIDDGDPATAAALAGALAAGDVTGGDVERAVAVLAATGAPGDAALIPLARDPRLDATLRAAVVRGLGGGTADAFDAIAGLAGAGRGELRRAVIDSLARWPAADLVARARAATGAAAGDLWRAAVVAAHGDATAQAAVHAALRDVLVAGRSYDERYRAIEALGEGDDADVGAVAAAARGLGDSAEAGALKAIAARALGRNTRAPAPAEALLVALAGDGDPGVRLAAVGALAGREPVAGGAGGGAWVDATPAGAQGAIDRVLGNALAGDHWPDIRRAAAAALGARCARPGPAGALATAVDGDADDDVRGDALAALVACRADGVGARLWKLADDDRAARALRVRAVDLAVALGDPALGAALEARFARWRGQAFSDDAALDLAVHAAIALGRLGDRAALPALIDAAGDGAFPELAAAAATAIGAMPPCPPAARRALDALSTSDQRNVALAARRARTQCQR